MGLQTGVTTGKDPGARPPARQAPCTAVCLISSGSKSRMPATSEFQTHNTVCSINMSHTIFGTYSH